MVTIIPFQDEYRKAWDDYVDRHAQGHLFFRFEWKNVIEKTFKLLPVYLVALNEAKTIEGVVPMFLMRGIWGKRYFISLPFCNFAGILADTETVQSALVAHLRKLAAEYDVEYVELRHLGTERKTTLPFKDSFVTLVVDLRSGCAELLRSLSTRNREKIRQAERSRLIFQRGIKHFEQFYDIFARTMRRLGTPVYPKLFFRNILDCYRDDADILVLRNEFEIVAAMFTMRHKNCLYELWACSLPQYNRIYANNLLCWKAFQYAIDLGLEYFDFGRSTRDSGTHNFKRQWGGTSVSLAYQYIFHNAKEIPRVDAHSNKYQPMIEVWKKLPLLITNRLGPRLIRYLPEL